jgi:hypothetical protein
MMWKNLALYVASAIAGYLIRAMYINLFIYASVAIALAAMAYDFYIYNTKGRWVKDQYFNMFLLFLLGGVFSGV